MKQNVLSIFSGTDVEGISALISQMEKSPFDYLKLEGDGVRIVIGKNGVTENFEASTPHAAASVVAPATAAVLPAPITESIPVAEAPAPASASAAEAWGTETAVEGPGVFVIKAPSYGMYYAQPDPSSPPYVTVGCTIKKGDTIGLLEIMKTFNAITSEVDGEVIAVHVKNEAMLEPGQALVSIRVK